MRSKREIQQQQKDYLFKLLAWIGSQARLAAQLGVSKQVVSGWVQRGRISATAAAEVDKKTNGLFKKEDLRPDVMEWDK